MGLKEVKSYMKSKEWVVLMFGGPRKALPGRLLLATRGPVC